MNLLPQMTNTATQSIKRTQERSDKNVQNE